MEMFIKQIVGAFLVALGIEILVTQRVKEEKELSTVEDRDL